MRGGVGPCARHVRSGWPSRAAARSGPNGLRAPGPDEVLVRALRSGVSRGTETLVFRGGVPADQYARDARAVPGRRLPRPGEVRLPERRRRRGGTGRAHGRDVFCLYPHQTAYVVPAAAVTVVPDGVPSRARRARRHGRDRGQRAVGRGAADRRPDRGRGRGHGRLLRRPAAGPDPAVDGHARRRRPGPRGRRRRARRRVRRPGGRTTAAATWSSIPARPPPGCSGRSSCWRRRAPSSTSAGTATARSRLPLGGAFHSSRLDHQASQVGMISPARRGRRSTRRPARPGAGAARRPCVRRAAHRPVVACRPARRNRPARRRRPDHAVPHHRLRGGRG